MAEVSDGSAALGLGASGPGAALPVMEGKSAPFRELTDNDSAPAAIDARDAGIC